MTTSLSCQTKPEKLWTPRIFNVDPFTMELRRLDPGQVRPEVHSCNDMKMKEFVCLTKKDLERVHAECLKEPSLWEKLF